MISMGKEKEPRLNILKLCFIALTKVAHFVVRLTPFGVFAIAAAAAGTMTIEEFGRLQVYFVTFIGSALLLAVVIYPFLTSMLTPFKYRDIVNLSKDALVTAFATGNLFVILPIITENSKALFKKYNYGDEETESLMDVIIPIYFNFPDSGKLISLLFVMFATWFIGAPMPIAKYPAFLFAGFFSFFGGVDMALPYLLNSFQIPSNLFQLYMVAGIINGRCGGKKQPGSADFSQPMADFGITQRSNEKRVRLLDIGSRQILQKITLVYQKRCSWLEISNVV